MDGSGFRKVNVKGVSAVALSEDTLLWMTIGGKTQSLVVLTLEICGDLHDCGPPEKRQLWFRDEQQQNRMWFQVDHQVVALKAISRSTQAGMCWAWFWSCCLKWY